MPGTCMTLPAERDFTVRNTDYGHDSGLRRLRLLVVCGLGCIWGLLFSTGLDFHS